jgi:hypothetical protein
LALEELGLGSSSLADESARLKLGRFVGANLMIFGGYQVVMDQMRIDLRMIEVETGRLVKAAQQTVSATDMAGWLEAAKLAAGELVRE